MGMTTGSNQAVINVTPMIDVLLVLLIIFMVITPLAPVGLKTAIPQDGVSTAGPPQPPVVIQVEANGQTRVNSQPVPVAELSEKLLSGVSPPSGQRGVRRRRGGYCVW
jgi:biopolymer transport protein ExbD